MKLNAVKESDYIKKEVKKPFYGLYYGQLAINLKPDRIKYFTSEIIDNAIVYNYENDNYTKVYDLDKTKSYKDGEDGYDVFLSGPSALLTIENNLAKTEKELIIFRDSFSSSIAPLLIDEYKKITLIDIRYIRSDILEKFIEFKNQDVLFLYSTTVLNNGIILK